MEGYLYILLCENGEYYTGSTNNLEKRLAEHWAGNGSNYTRKNKPKELVYSEKFDQIDQAFRKEKQIQKWSHEKKTALINGDFELLRTLSKKRF